MSKKTNMVNAVVDNTLGSASRQDNCLELVAHGVVIGLRMLDTGEVIYFGSSVAPVQGTVSNIVPMADTVPEAVPAVAASASAPKAPRAEAQVKAQPKATGKTSPKKKSEAKSSDFPWHDDGGRNPRVLSKEHGNYVFKDSEPDEKGKYHALGIYTYGGIYDRHENLVGDGTYTPEGGWVPADTKSKASYDALMANPPIMGADGKMIFSDIAYKIYKGLIPVPTDTGSAPSEQSASAPARAAKRRSPSANSKKKAEAQEPVAETVAPVEEAKPVEKVTPPQAQPENTVKMELPEGFDARKYHYLCEDVEIAVRTRSVEQAFEFLLNQHHAVRRLGTTSPKDPSKKVVYGFMVDGLVFDMRANCYGVGDVGLEGLSKAISKK